MPTPHRETLLCRYHYDPLDRLIDSTPSEQPTQRYYCKTRLATEIQGGAHRSILQHQDQLLAQQQREAGTIAATLLATDQLRSVLNALDGDQPNPISYSPYGHRPLENGLLSLLGFNGERSDPVTGHYLLGNYRHFNPVLMRFNSPDSWSPFGKGGLNSYAYCGGDPRNRVDPTGHFWTELFRRVIGKKTKALKSSNSPQPPKRVYRVRPATDIEQEKLLKISSEPLQSTSVGLTAQNPVPHPVAKTGTSWGVHHKNDMNPQGFGTAGTSNTLDPLSSIPRPPPLPRLPQQRALSARTANHFPLTPTDASGIATVSFANPDTLNKRVNTIRDAE